MSIAQKTLFSELYYYVTSVTEEIYTERKISLTAALMSVASSTRTTVDDTGDSEDWFVRQTEKPKPPVQKKNSKFMSTCVKMFLCGDACYKARVIVKF